MRYLFILLIIISFVSLASGQENKPKEIPIRDVFPISYRNTKELKVSFDEAVTTLKTSPDLKIYVVYYKGRAQNKSDFNLFKLKVQMILVKSNKITAKRVSIIDSGNYYYQSSSFIIWITDKDGKPID